MNIYSIKAKDINSNEIPLKRYQGKILLIVNTASECSFTHQYEGLQRIYEYFGEDNIAILAFPCNQFGQQEPCSQEEISHFVKNNFGISFPMFAKIEVNGPNEHPLYRFLKLSYPGEIKWNFEKFLVDRDGTVCGRFDSMVEPRDIVDEIDELI